MTPPPNGKAARAFLDVVSSWEDLPSAAAAAKVAAQVYSELEGIDPAWLLLEGSIVIQRLLLEIVRITGSDRDQILFDLRGVVDRELG